MKYIKYFENNYRISKICEEYNINNWELHNGLISVEKDVDLDYYGLTKLPLNFKYINGYFWCCRNKLTTLRGCPEWIGGDFFCHNNQLTTLEFAPLKVSGYILWHNNPLPEEILNITDQKMRRLFLYFQHDYTLWKNGQFVKWKFEDLMDEINEYLEKHPEGIKFTY